MNTIRSISLINYLAWIFIGVVVGIVSETTDHIKIKGGAVGTTLFGILGAVCAGILDRAFLHVPMGGFSFSAFIVSTSVSILLATSYRLLARNLSQLKLPIIQRGEKNNGQQEGGFNEISESKSYE